MKKNNLQKNVNEYIESLRKALSDDPKSLSTTERKLASRAEANRAVATKAEEEINRLLDQIKQAQARVRSLELQKEAALGKASGLYEALASEKFDMDGEPEIVEPEPEVETPVETNA